jgi:spoIIIJ-associated protein
MQILEFTNRLLAHMGLDDAKVDIEEGEMISVQITVPEEESGLLIGYHGDSLSAIQKVLQLIYGRDEGSKKIIVNVNDYKQRREAQLQEMAVRAGKRVLETGQTYLFAYLPANERLIVHETIAKDPEFSQLETVSSGEGFQRRLEIRFKQE